MVGRHTPPSPDSDGIGPVLAGNLKALRQERNLSLDELAQRTGVSRAMLHQIESGRSVPTINVAWKISQGLHVPFSRLIQERQTATTRLLPAAEAKVLSNAARTFSSRALFPLDGPRTVEFYELLIQPGGSEVAEPHAPGTGEHLVLVRGTVEVEVAGEKHLLRPHDALWFKADVPHAYRNIGLVGDALLYLVMTYPDPVSF
jgi:transcriptional regulator with XRE-family HTH domain